MVDERKELVNNCGRVVGKRCCLVSLERGEKRAFERDEFWEIEKGFRRGFGEKGIGPRIGLDE